MSNYRNKTTGTVSTQGELRRANSNTSFPRVWDADVCELLDIEPILDSAKPSHSDLQTVISDGVKLDEKGHFTQAWIVVAKFSDTTDEAGVVTTKATHEAEYTASETAKLAKAAREKRDGLMAATDWVVLRAKELGQPVPLATFEYRGDLRQVPDQVGFPSEITWPIKPQGALL